MPILMYGSEKMYTYFIT